VIAVNKADGAMQSAAELAAGQYRDALHSLAGRAGNPPAVVTCSALHRKGVDAVWEIIQRRQQRLKATGELAERRRRQNLRGMWSLVEDHLRLTIHTHPDVQSIRADLERDVLAGTIPAEAAARRILEAFGIRSSHPAS
jgi:LAO/AO transport system kinase